MTDTGQETLDERVARLRTELCTTEQGSQALVELTPLGMVHTDGNIVDFTDWSKSWSQWQ